MKKRILAVLCVMCVLLLSGCGLDDSAAAGNAGNPPATTAAPQKTSFEIIHEALKKTDALDTMNAEMQMDISISMADQTLEMPMSVIYKAKDMNSGSPVIQSQISTSVMGQSTQIDMYQEGNWAYITAQGQNFKADISAGNPYDQTGSFDNIMMDLPENLLANLPMVQNPDGSQTLTLSIPNEAFAEIYGDMLESINSSTGTGSATSLSIKDATVKITVANGYLAEYSMSFSMDMTVTGVETNSSITAGIIFHNPGQDVVITPPAGYQDYPTMG